jgi:excisionase family DNA binding protein
MKDAFLTAADVAERLGLTRQTVYALVDNGALPALRLGSGPKARLRIRQDDFDSFVDASRPAGAHDAEQREAKLAEMHDHYLLNRASSILLLEGKDEVTATADELLAAYAQAEEDLEAKLSESAVPRPAGRPHTHAGFIDARLDVHKRALEILEKKGIETPTYEEYRDAVMQANDELGHDATDDLRPAE